jgi:hypothetical protein
MMIFKIRRMIAFVGAACLIVITLGLCRVNARGLPIFSEGPSSNGTAVSRNIDEPNR